MDKYPKADLDEALKLIDSTIQKCEKMQLKFKKGTSQHSLLKNRLKAMYITRSLIREENILTYTKEELIEALPPINSIISKCEKGQQKYIEGTPYFNRFKKLINAMNISKSLLENEIDNREKLNFKY